MKLNKGRYLRPRIQSRIFNFHLALFENRKREYLSKVIELIYGRRLDNLSHAHVADEYKIKAYSTFQRSHQKPLYLWKI